MRLVKNTDESGWSEKEQKRWLWTAATATVALFVIHLRRSFEGLQSLLGETIAGIVCSNRWSAYSKLPLEQRQICWAHLKCDFQMSIDRGGPAEAIGRVGLDVVECLFADWRAFHRSEVDRPVLQARLDLIARELQGVWQQGRSCANSKTANFCANILALYPALWFRGDRGGRTHAQSCGTHPTFRRAVAHERFRLPKPGGLLIRGADQDRRANPRAAKPSSARLPVSRNRGSSCVRAPRLLGQARD